jgi:surface protein
MQHIVNLYINAVKTKPTYKLDKFDINVPTSVEIEFDDSIGSLERLFEKTTVLHVDFSLFDSRNIKSLAFLFNGCNILESVEFGNFNTSKVVDMQSMFRFCHNLKFIELPNFDTSNVTDFSYMFGSCNSIKCIDLKNFNTSKSEKMSGMFELCNKLKTVNILNFDVSNVKYMDSMFSYDDKLETIKIKEFNTKSAIDCSYMFYQCSKLHGLDTKKFNSDGRILSMRSMFEFCQNIKKIKFGNVVTNETADIEYMFNYCNKLLDIEINKFSNYNQNMFNNCPDLRLIYLKDKIVTIQKYKTKHEDV